ncbi:hypothetical protein P9754_14470, partial [Geobacillus thermoleovorans]|nr:hypothetical protein [Geobacillus thermoleovorans]
RPHYEKGRWIEELWQEEQPELLALPEQDLPIFSLDHAYVNKCKLSFYFSTKRPFFCTFFQKALSPFLKECAKFFVNCFGQRFPFVSMRGRKCDPVSRLWH